jgi:uncharacterized protein YdbL (DUF1318 family)
MRSREDRRAKTGFGSAAMLARGCERLACWFGAFPLMLASAYGAQPDLNVTTPAIKAIRETMTARAEQLAKHKDLGHVGEGRDGMLAVRSLEGLGLGEKKAVEDLVAAENADRKALYREILVANGLKEDDAARVLEQAARMRRAASAPGHYVQDPRTGSWELKRDLKE